MLPYISSTVVISLYSLSAQEQDKVDEEYATQIEHLFVSGNCQDQQNETGLGNEPENGPRFRC